MRILGKYGCGGETWSSGTGMHVGERDGHFVGVRVGKRVCNLIGEHEGDLAGKSVKKQHGGGIGKRVRKGFTLAELMLVMMMMIVLFGAAVTSFVNSQRLFVFNGAFQQLGLITRQARSLALTGQAQIDYNDYDRDGCKNGGSHEAKCIWGESDPRNDYTTPLNYGVHFEPASGGEGGGEIVLFADMFGTTEAEFNSVSGQKVGEYVSSPSVQDIIVVRYEVPESLDLILYPIPASATGKTITYSPIFADTNLVGSEVDFFVFGLRERNSVTSRISCYAIHPISGVIERADDVGVEDKCV